MLFHASQLIRYRLLLSFSRFLNDDFSQFSTLALSGGVRLDEMRKLEVAFLQSLDSDLWVDPMELFLLKWQLVQQPTPITRRKGEDLCSLESSENNVSKEELM